MKRYILTLMAVLLVLCGLCTAAGAVTPNQWTGSGPFATGGGNRVVYALAVSSDGTTVYTGTESGTVFSYAVTPPAATTRDASGVGGAGATLNGTVNAENADTTVSFQYGSDTSYGTTVAASTPTVTGPTDTDVSAAIGSLAPGATYHFRVVATSSSGTSYGGDLTFRASLSPAITSADHATFTYGTPGTFTVSTTGSPPPALTRTGGLPAGVTFHDNGDGTATIAGTANTAGSFPITITAANGVGTNATQAFTLTVTPPDPATLSGADTNLSVVPDRYLFGVETLGSCGTSRPITFTVRNTGPASRTLGALGFGGVDADQFALDSTTCSGATLTAGGTCTAAVKFCPTSLGSKSATLQIPSDAPNTPTLTALLYSHETTDEEAARRMPPVLESLAIPAGMQSGQQYTITWSLLGYDDDYLSRVVFFNCSGKAAGSCGNSYADNFADSGNLSVVSSETDSWSYNGILAKRFDYSYSFTPPTVAGATDIVIRFYKKSGSDDAAGFGSLSLLVPGNVLPNGASYYDNEGRRISCTITPGP